MNDPDKIDFDGDESDRIWRTERVLGTESVSSFDI